MLLLTWMHDPHSSTRFEMRLTLEQIPVPETTEVRQSNRRASR